MWTPPKYTVHAESQSWSSASRSCKDEGRNLVSYHSYEERAAVHDLTEGMYFWTGLSDSGNRDWRWSDGTPTDYTIWNSGEPSGSKKNAKDCIYDTSLKYGLSSSDCYNKFYFVCGEQI